MAVGLSVAVLEECRSGSTNVLRLHKVLYAWIAGNHQLVPTTCNLNKILASPLVGAPQILVCLEQPFLNELKMVRLTYSVQMEYQSDDTEVADGKSTLLEVRVGNSEGVSYQWMKDGQCLCDGEDYSGTSTDILVIKHAHQGTQGQYTCTVERGQEKDMSQSISVRVLYSYEKEHLINIYSRRSEVPRDTWPPVGTKTFINLVLIKKNGMHENDYAFSVQGDVDDIVESKEKIQYEEVFGKHSCGSLVLVEGRPGCGKTTLVHKVARDWALGEGTLKRAQLVFLVPLRLLTSTGNYYSLSNLLKLFFEKAELNKSVVNKIEEVDGENTCFILDGLDEYCDKKLTASIVYRIMHKTYLPKAMVIVASRPVATADLKFADMVTQQIEVIGFTHHQIFDYVDTFPFEGEHFQKCDRISKIKSYLIMHPNILQMCYLPVHAAMICFLFQHLKDNFPATETKIYEEFTRCAILRKLRRTNNSVVIRSFDDIHGNDRVYFCNLCRLAFDMTLKSKQVAFKTDTTFSLYPTVSIDMPDSPYFGLITIDHTAKLFGLEQVYTFLHLTFQEYLAALHIASLPDMNKVI